MALIAMAVYSTEENGKDKYLARTLNSLEKTVDWDSNRLILSVNGYTKRTLEIIEDYSQPDAIVGPMISEVIFNDKNLGTAEAINLAWQKRVWNENAIKMDDDVVIHQDNWIQEMENAIAKDPTIGIIGLKRKDLWENPSHKEDFYRSELIMLPHTPGENWIVVEKVNHVMGTCQMYSAALLGKIGYLYQPDLYGFDDSLAAIRCKLSGFYNCFLPHIQIDHIDPGGTPYQKWKEEHAGKQWLKYHLAVDGYKTGEKSLYYNPFKNDTDNNN